MSSLLIISALVSAPVFLSPEEVNTKLSAESSGLVILDARTNNEGSAYLPRSIKVDWRDFLEHRTPTVFNLWAVRRNGKISDDEGRIAQQLSELGLRPADDIVVYGDANKGFGEEGRIWWMLNYFGFQNVAILDGGVTHWRSRGFPIVQRVQSSRRPSSPKKALTLTSSVRATLVELQARMRGRTPVLLDTRTREEYDGATPYFSKRGGRIPGAKHLFWKHLLGDNGRIRPRRDIEKILGELNISKKSGIITYCTGGVRSAFVQAVLIHYGYLNTQNYDGSWWEWSRESRLPVEIGEKAGGSLLSK